MCSEKWGVLGRVGCTVKRMKQIRMECNGKRGVYSKEDKADKNGVYWAEWSVQYIG